MTRRRVHPDEMAETERELRAAYDELRFQAPNPRDFPTWEAFYAAQAQHEARLAELQSKLDKFFEAW